MNTDDSKALYARTRDELVAKQLSNSETYDQSILSLSSAFLGISVSFISDVFPLATAHSRWLLFLSWLSFAAAIIVTISSFIYGQRGIKQLIAAARAYYLEKRDDAYSVSERVGRGIDRFNLAAGGTFIAGILFTILFALINAGDHMSTPQEGTRSQPTNSFEQRPAPTKEAQEPAPAQPTNRPQGGADSSEN